MIARFLTDERGHTAIEYALIAVCICVAIIATVQTFGVEVNEMFGDARDGFSWGQ